MPLNGESNEYVLESVLKGSGKKAHINVVALNTALVLWVAGIEDNLSEGIKKALFSMSKAKPWDKFTLLKNYLKSWKTVSNKWIILSRKMQD